MKDSRPTLDVIVTCSYVPETVSLSILERTIRSILSLSDVSKGSVDARLLIAIDGLPPELNHKKHIQRRNKWIKKLHKRFASKAIIIVKPTWGHLSGLLCFIVHKFTDASSLLIVQDDLSFTRDIPLKSLIQVINRYPKVKHIRFNKRSNNVCGLDTNLLEERFDQMLLLKTNNWSDNNYLMLRSHFNEVIFPLILGVNTFPENILRVENHNEPNLFGTYIYGGFGDRASIKHLGTVRGRVRSQRNKYGAVAEWILILKLANILARTRIFARNCINRFGNLP